MVSHRIVSWVLLTLVWAGCGPSERADRVVLVTIDTLRADRVGSYGAAGAHTPNLDTVAAQGVRFEVAISPAPLTLPAHASLLTALDPPRHGVRHNSIHRLGEHVPTVTERMRDAGYPAAAFVGSLVLDRRFGLARGFEPYDDRMERRSAGTIGYAERTADRVTDAVLAWLADAPDRFFLWVHFYDPHTSYDPPAGFAAAFASRPYDGEIAFADAQLGRLLAGIHARYGADGLLLAVTSDHGESLGEHGEPTHSYTVYDATQRVPLLMSGPGIPAGVVVEAPVRLVDVAPTLLASVGAEALPDPDGRDLLPLVRGEQEAPRLAYVETLATQLDFGWSPLHGIRSGEYKYIRAPRPELYDLRRDPAELHDRSRREPERVARFEAALRRRLERERPPTAVALPEADRARLRALGYLAPAGAGAAAPGDEAPDPKDEIGLLDRMARAEALMSRGRPAQALEVLRDLSDPPAAVSALRAAIAFNAGEPAMAERDARRVLAVEPGRADVLVVLGMALEAQGDAPGARAAFLGASRLDPANTEANQGLARVGEPEAP